MSLETLIKIRKIESDSRELHCLVIVVDIFHASVSKPLPFSTSIPVLLSIRSKNRVLFFMAECFVF